MHVSMCVWVTSFVSDTIESGTSMNLGACMWICGCELGFEYVCEFVSLSMCVRVCYIFHGITKVIQAKLPFRARFSQEEVDAFHLANQEEADMEMEAAIEAEQALLAFGPIGNRGVVVPARPGHISVRRAVWPHGDRDKSCVSVFSTCIGMYPDPDPDPEPEPEPDPDPDPEPDPDPDPDPDPVPDPDHQDA